MARQRFAGAQLAAQEAAHLLNNDLMLTMGQMDLVRYSQDLAPTLEPLVESAIDGMSAAAEHVRQLQQLRRVVTTDGPMGPRLDLGRSTT